jgi:hypothetical protein
VTEHGRLERVGDDTQREGQGVQGNKAIPGEEDLTGSDQW